MRRQAGGALFLSDLFLTVISVYTLTFRTPKHSKEKFWINLQGCLAEVPGSDKLLLLGDFSAWVGHHKSGEDL